MKKEVNLLNFNALVKDVKNLCSTHSNKVETKDPNSFHLDNGEEEIMIFCTENNLVLKYFSHKGMNKEELDVFKSLGRTWKNPYSYKKYGLSILISPNDWYFNNKKVKILGLIRGMNIRR